MSIKIGDVVRLKEENECEGDPGLSDEMERYCGSSVTVTAINREGHFHISEDGGEWIYSQNWIVEPTRRSVTAISGRISYRGNAEGSKKLKGLLRQINKLTPIDAQASRGGIEIKLDLSTSAKSLRSQFMKKKKELGLRKGDNNV